MNLRVPEERWLPVGKNKDALANYYKTLLGVNTEVTILLVNVQKNITVKVANDS